MSAPFPEPIVQPLADLPSQAAVIRAVFEGADVAQLIQEQLNHLHADITDASAYMTLALLYQLAGQRENAMGCQDAGLHYARLYRQQTPGSTLKLLCIAARGDLMTNTPVELMLEGLPVEIQHLYVDAQGGLPDFCPDHDVALMSIGESDETRAALSRLMHVSRLWPKPMVNESAAILDLARDRLWRKLEGAPGLVMPPTVRASAQELMAVAQGERPVDDLLPGCGFPLIVRPVGSHAGKGLELIESAFMLEAYVDLSGVAEMYVSPFVDYASADGKHRKSRIAFFGGRPFLAHMAVGDHWMVHYLNAGMGESEAKRAEEAEAMRTFDDGFAVRHAAALAALHQRLGLDYFAVDCAETADGRLLVFEADVSMIVHALDPESVYPYKKPAMAKLFAAFEDMLRQRAKG